LTKAKFYSKSSFAGRSVNPVASEAMNIVEENLLRLPRENLEEQQRYWAERQRLSVLKAEHNA
jgi:hypothetical protein